MDLSIPYLITSSALILFDWITYKSQSSVSSASLSTELESLSSLSTELVSLSTELESGVTTLSDGLSIRETDKSGTELILDPPIDHPMHHYKEQLIYIWSEVAPDNEMAVIATGLVVDVFISRLNGIDYPIISVLVEGEIIDYDANEVIPNVWGLNIHNCHGLFC